jgi:hypothetical protein
MLRPSELGSNLFKIELMPKAKRRERSSFNLLFQICRELKTIADADHRFYLQAERLKFGA